MNWWWLQWLFLCGWLQWRSSEKAQHARSMLHLLKGALDSVLLPSLEAPFAIADLGCSCGDNTLFIVDVIIKHLSKRYEALRLEPPEFQAYFSDLPSNDFNTLFQLLPPLSVKGSLEECLAGDDGSRSYYAAGVPGSFYRRLFPAKSINVFHSAFSLHWLSQVRFCWTKHPHTHLVEWNCTIA